jgi:hypothetical protein
MIGYHRMKIFVLLIFHSFYVIFGNGAVILSTIYKTALCDCLVHFIVLCVTCCCTWLWVLVFVANEFVANELYTFFVRGYELEYKSQHKTMGTTGGLPDGRNLSPVLVRSNVPSVLLASISTFYNCEKANTTGGICCLWTLCRDTFSEIYASSIS